MAVVVLTPLAAFEAVLGPPLAVQYRQRVHRSGERVYEVLDAPEPVREPETPRQAPASPFPVVPQGLAARHAGQDRDGPGGAGPDSGGGPPCRRGRSLRVRQDDAGPGAAAVPRRGRGFLHAGRRGRLRPGRRRRTAPGRGCARRPRTSSTARCARTCSWPGRTPPRTNCATRWAGPGCWSGADSLPDGLDTLVGEHGARLCRRASGSGWHSPGRCSPTSPSSYSTSRGAPRPADRRRAHRRSAGRHRGAVPPC